MRHLVPSSLVAVLVASAIGCADSHGLDGNTDAGHDGGRRCDVDTGPIGPPFYCVQVSDHVCSDALITPGCVDGAFQCPAGTTPETSAECWCSGGAPAGCECTPSGWQCATDAGPGEVCPPDLSSAEGTPCSLEGASCGRCTDSCGFCNVLRCEGGEWIRLEAHPRPPPCTSFDCGPELRCAAEFEYCEHVVSDVAGFPDDYACRALPAGCTACDCMPSPEFCEQGPEGGLTVTYPGG